MIVAEQCDKPDVSIYEPVHNNNASTFATLYQVVKHTKDRDQKTVLKEDRNVLRRLIDAVFNKLPSGSASPLLAYHALTGCDNTSDIANHTKRSSRKICIEHHGLLKNLGIGELTDDTIQSSETFVCRIYNVHKTDSIDAARHLLFSKTGKPEAMATTSDALRFHLKRVHYQSMIWRNAHCPHLSSMRPQKWDGDLWIQNCSSY